LLRQAPLHRVGPGAVRRVFARPFELDFSIHTYTARTGACLEFPPRRHGIDVRLHQSEGGMVGDLALKRASGVQSYGSVTLPLMTKHKGQTPHVVMIDRKRAYNLCLRLATFLVLSVSIFRLRASSSHPTIVWKCFFYDSMSQIHRLAMPYVELVCGSTSRLTCIIEGRSPRNY
jgi:hypothetical protein